ncbi:hypothetical protein RND81_10G244000 [Saponaria officinalis]
MRFRCVCKSWYSFITHDLEFHKLHLLNFNLNNKDPRWMGYQLGSDYDYRTTNFWLYDESFHSDNIQACHFHWDETTPVNFCYSLIVSSCNGIICLYLPVNDALGKVEGEGGFVKFLICLLNPSIRKYRRIDFPWKDTFYYGLPEDVLVVFGLSIKSSVYKLVVIRKDFCGEYHVYVYSCRTSSWTEIKTKSFALQYRFNKEPGTYFNGFCHWIWVHTREGDQTMMCFNLEDENFSYIDLPPKSQISTDHFRIVIFKDMFCVWETIEMGENFAVNIWGMKEYGNCSSWSMFQRVDIQYLSIRLFGIDVSGRLLFSTWQGDSLLRACDSNSEEIHEFESCETVSILNMVPCQESLLLL